MVAVLDVSKICLWMGCRGDEHMSKTLPNPGESPVRESEFIGTG